MSEILYPDRHCLQTEPLYDLSEPDTACITVSTENVAYNCMHELIKAVWLCRAYLCYSKRKYPP